MPDLARDTIRRRADGSIDIQAYLARARVLRAEAARGLLTGPRVRDDGCADPSGRDHDGVPPCATAAGLPGR